MRVLGAIAVTVMASGFAVAVHAADVSCGPMSGSTARSDQSANIPAGAASDRQQVASGLDPNPGANIPAGAASDRQQQMASNKDALGNTLNPSTGTTVPGTGGAGVASERQRPQAMQDCK
jgi:hypothetical protein